MIYERLSANKRKKILNNLLYREIAYAIKIIEDQDLKPDTIPTAGLNLLITSGDLKLFTSDQADQLTVAYYDIKRYSAEAKRTRDAIEIDVVKSVIDEKGYNRSNTLKSQLTDQGNELLEKLLVIRKWLKFEKPRD
jgi:hypothetical protein